MLDVETTLEELNACLAVINELEALPLPLDDFALLRLDACRAVARKHLKALQTVADAKRAAGDFIEQVTA